MSSARSTFRINDIKRLLQAAASAGVKPKRVEVDKDGKMSLIVDDGEADTAASVNAWDEAAE